MPTTTNFSITLPTVGGSQDTWGDTLNAAFDTVDGLLAGSSQVAPNLGTANSVNWKIGGVEVTASATDINKLDGLTASQTELNIMDGGTTPSDISIATTDKIIVNDGGSMKQVYASKIENFIVDHVNDVGTLNAGNIASGFGTIVTSNLIQGSEIRWAGADSVLQDRNDYEITHFVDEDDMASDSASALPTQQSVKAYVDNTVSSSANETGKVLQVVTGVATTVSTSSYTAQQWNDTAVTVSFTPKAVGSTFLVEVFAHFGGYGYNGLALKSQVDNETAVRLQGGNGTGDQTSALAFVSGISSEYGPEPVSFAYTDDSIVYDADSETITYTVIAKPAESNYTMFLNRGRNTSNNEYAHYIASSTIKVTEIAG